MCVASRVKCIAYTLTIHETPQLVDLSVVDYLNEFQELLHSKKNCSHHSVNFISRHICHRISITLAPDSRLFNPYAGPIM